MLQPVDKLATSLLRTHLVDKLWDFYVCRWSGVSRDTYSLASVQFTEVNIFIRSSSPRLSFNLYGGLKLHVNDTLGLFGVTYVHCVFHLGWGSVAKLATATGHAMLINFNDLRILCGVTRFLLNKLFCVKTEILLIFLCNITRFSCLHNIMCWVYTHNWVKKNLLNLCVNLLKLMSKYLLKMLCKWSIYQVFCVNLTQ